MTQIHQINAAKLTIKQVGEVVSNRFSLKLSDDALQRVEQCCAFLDKKLSAGDALYYGINTGFGSLCNIKISDEEIEQLQSNLVQSHACGMGETVPLELVRYILFLKIQSLSYGHSAIRPTTIQRLIDFFNHDVLPVLYTQGSLGASGDLAPLAHLSLPLIGLGEVWYKGQKQDAAKVNQELGWTPLKLKPKEGLALLNGTQFSAAYGVFCLHKSQRLLQLANLSAATSIDAFDCRLTPFDERLHTIRHHQGQIEVAKRIRHLLAGSEIANNHKVNVQDPYAFRCVPQVHGASYDALTYIESVFEREINAVTDNPNLFPETDAILSGGNFHAQPLALPLDYLAIAIAELGSISERRTYQLISGIRGLTAFLTPKAGLHSGLMIPQYTAASIVSQNKQYCTPASIDSIVSSNGQEDHVSMAANAATKALKVVNNVESVLAIEFMTAMQALDFRRPMKSSGTIENIYQAYRQKVPTLQNDRILSTDMHLTVEFLKGLDLENIL